METTEFTGRPRVGTVIPEEYRPEGSNNALLNTLPAYRERIGHLNGVPLYLPLSGMVVVPFDVTECVVVHGNGHYKPGDRVYLGDWEMQRALRVVIDLRPATESATEDEPGIAIVETDDHRMIKVLRTEQIVVQPDGTRTVGPAKAVSA